MRNPTAPKVVRLRELLRSEIDRGNCGEELAVVLLNAFLSFEVDFAVSSDGELRWWLITDEDYAKMLERDETRPDE